MPKEINLSELVGVDKHNIGNKNQQIADQTQEFIKKVIEKPLGHIEGFNGWTYKNIRGGKVETIKSLY